MKKEWIIQAQWGYSLEESRGEIHTNHTLKNVNMCASKTQRKNSVSSSCQLQGFTIMCDMHWYHTFSPIQSEWTLCDWGREGANPPPTAAEIFTSPESSCEPSHSNIKQHSRVPCSVYIRQTDKVLFTSPSSWMSNRLSNTKTRLKQAPNICMESCYWQSLDTEV